MNIQNDKRQSFKKIGLVFAVAAAIGLTGCDPEFSNSVDDTSQFSAGDADFARFVAVGDSLTAGFADSALYIHGQQNSYPAILAQQFALVGGGAFTQPLMNDNLGGLLLGGNPIAATRLVLTGPSPDALSPAPISGVPTTEVQDVLNGTFNNMGVPGAKSFHLGFVGYGDVAGVAGGTANPYYARMAMSSVSTMIADAANQGPSFFILWIGNNDTLSYATTGGIGVDQLGNLDPTTYGSNDLTDPSVFASVFSQYVTALTAAGGKGILITLPDVTSIPYFTTVPFNAIPMDQATADASNAAYVAYNGGLQVSGIPAAEVAQRTINFVAGQNAVVIEDETLTDLTGGGLPSIRQATADDLIVLPASATIGTLADPMNPASVIGVGVALGDGDVLTASEIALVAAANTAYNTTIAGIAAGNPDLVLFDAAAIFADIAVNGIDYGSGIATTTFATGGLFSLDGVHPTARGYAILSNLIMETIENEFGAVLQRVDPGAYTTTFVE
ncbi:MAG: G-D-S-L family lipolytic protein [Pseudomonadota bacterium]